MRVDWFVMAGYLLPHPLYTFPLNLSRVFRKNDVSLIGRKLSVYSILPGFGIRLTLTSLHAVGIYFRPKEHGLRLVHPPAKQGGGIK